MESSTEERTTHESKAQADEVVDSRLVTLAENIGWFLGTVQNRADDWLDREAVRSEVTRIRTGAAELLRHLNLRRSAARKPAAKKRAASARPSRGANVDAPGKKHRKPPPQEKVTRGMSDSAAKRMGKKTPNIGLRRKGAPG